MMEYTQDVNAEIGKRIAEIRKYRNISQTALAVSCDLSKAYISELENGKRTIRPKFIKQLVNHDQYPINTEWLLDGIGEMKRAPGEMDFVFGMGKFSEHFEAFGIRLVWLKLAIYRKYLMDDGTVKDFKIDNKKVYVAISHHDENEADRFYANPKNIQKFRSKWEARHSSEKAINNPPSDMLEFFIADELNEAYNKQKRDLKLTLRRSNESMRGKDKSIKKDYDALNNECRNLIQLIDINKKHLTEYKKTLIYKYKRLVNWLNKLSDEERRALKSMI